MPRLSALLREPVVLFALIGALLFGTDRWLNGAATGHDAETHIVIGASQQAAFRDAFRAEHGREPSADEMQQRLTLWIEEQVLYREALALGLDRKDAIVHRELTQKMRFLLEDATPLAKPTDAELQAWLDQHAERYGQPPTLSFQQVFLSRGRHAERLQADAMAVGTRLTQAPEQFAALSDPFPAGTVIERATPLQLRREFGPDFAAAVEKLPQSRWSGPIASSLGLHFVRPTGRGAFRAATLADVRARVLTDYETAAHERLSQAAIDQLKRKYRITVEGAAG